MSKRPRYLVIIPPALQRTPALFRAMALAKQTEAELELGLFDFDASLNKARSRGFDLKAYLEGRHRELEEFASHLRREGFSVKASVHWGSPVARQILAQVLALKPDLVVKDVQTEPALKRVLLRGLDYELLRLCPAPLMLVRPGDHNLPKHLLAAVDPLDENNRPHELNKRILDAAEKYGMTCGAEVDVVHAFQPVPVMASATGFGGAGLDSRLMSELRTQHEHALKELGAEFGVEERHQQMLDGYPPDVIPTFAATYCVDLLVVGTTYRGGFERFMLGSVADQLCEQINCDVLALKPAGFADALAKQFDLT